MNNKRNEKELSMQERKRIEIFNKEKSNLIENGYIEHDLTINVVKANLLAFIVPLPIIAFLALIFFLTGNKLIFNSNEITFIIIIINLVLSTIIHESIHGLTFGIFATNHFKDIAFGIIWKTLTPYCNCLKPLKRYQYFLGILMPAIVLGIIPCILASIIGNSTLLVSGFFQLLCAGGDLSIIGLALLNVPKTKDAIYYDHPTECGVVLFDKE